MEGPNPLQRGDNIVRESKNILNDTYTNIFPQNQSMNQWPDFPRINDQLYPHLEQG